MAVLRMGHLVIKSYLVPSHQLGHLGPDGARTSNNNLTKEDHVKLRLRQTSNSSRQVDSFNTKRRRIEKKMEEELKQRIAELERLEVSPTHIFTFFKKHKSYSLHSPHTTFK